MASNDQKLKVELDEVQKEQDALQCTLAAQNKIETIRGEYVALRTLVVRIHELKGGEAPSQAQKSFWDSLVQQERDIDLLAASLERFLE